MTPPAAPPTPRHCEACGKAIAYNRVRWKRYAKQRFCSKACCGRYHSGAKHGSWKGGLIDDNGYRRASVYAFPAVYRHLLWPMVRKHRIDMPEHRAVMAIKLGRSLKRTETVHHLNGNKLDNRPENLELRIGPHGTGATASVFICPHCHKRYDDPSN